MWPFEKRLRDQNALEKYSRWLRRWLMDTAKGKSKRNSHSFEIVVTHSMQP